MEEGGLTLGTGTTSGLGFIVYICMTQCIRRANVLFLLSYKSQSELK